MSQRMDYNAATPAGVKALGGPGKNDTAGGICAE